MDLGIEPLPRSTGVAAGRQEPPGPRLDVLGLRRRRTVGRERQRARHAVAESGLGVDGQRGLADRWAGPDDEDREQDQAHDRDARAR